MDPNVKLDMIQQVKDLSSHKYYGFSRFSEPMVAYYMFMDILSDFKRRHQITYDDKAALKRAFMRKLKRVMPYMGRGSGGCALSLRVVMMGEFVSLEEVVAIINRRKTTY